MKSVRYEDIPKARSKSRLVGQENGASRSSENDEPAPAVSHLDRVHKMSLGRPLSEIGANPLFQHIVLALITILAIGLRMYKLGDWSFWIDEIFTINRTQAHYSSLALALQHLPPHTNWIPVSSLLIAVTTSVLGTSEWSVRLIPAIIGGLSIPAFYWPVKKLLGTEVALISALLLAVSPWHIMWSQNGRFYTALVLFYTLALIAFNTGLERNRPAFLIAGLSLFYLALSERQVAVLLLPVIAVYLVLLMFLRFSLPAGLNRGSIAILSVPVIAGLSIEAHSLLTSGNSRFLGDIGVFVGNAIDSPTRILILMFFSIGTPVVVLGIFAGGWLVWQRSRAGLFLLISAIVPIILLVGISPWVFIVERYALVTLPAWLVLAAVAIQRLLSWVPRQGIWLAGAVLSLLLVHAAGEQLAYYALNNGNRLDWRGAYEYIATHKAQGDMVASDRPEIGSYYLRASEAVIDLKELNVTELVALNRRIWFVVDSQGIWAVSSQNREWLEDNAKLLFVWYLRLREQTDLRVYRFDPIGLIQ